jgi:uncharacterized integral membrane protein
MQGKFLVILGLALLISLFAVLNTEPVTVNLLVFRGELPLVLLIFACAGVGALAGVLLGLGDIWNGHRKIQELNDQVQKLQYDLQSMTAKQAQAQEDTPE